jgi:hypothetical protein
MGGAFRPHKPVTSGRRVGSVSNNGRSGSVASNANEAQGEEAYDRIRQLARGSNGTRHVIDNTNNSHRNSRTQSKPLLGARPWPPKPSARHPDIGHKTDTETCKVLTKEDEDIAKAIKLSLADATIAPPTAPSTRKTETSYDADITKAKFLSLSNDDDDDSSTISSSESSYNVPDALHDLYDTMGAFAKVLEEKARKLEKVTAGTLADCVREWEGTTFRAIHTLKAAENRRIKDIRMQLDFDKGVEEKHQKQLDATNKLWEAKMGDKEREWGERMVDQKRLYEARFAEATRPSPSSQEQSLGEEQMQCRCVKLSPPTQVAATSPTREIATPNVGHIVDSFNTEARYEASVNFLKQKIDHLRDENAALQLAQKTKDENTTLSTKKMKQMYEAQIRLLKNRVEGLAAANAEVSQSKEGRAVRAEPPQRSGAGVSPGKRNLGNGVKCEDSPPKKAKNGLMD